MTDVSMHGFSSDPNAEPADDDLAGLEAAVARRFGSEDFEPPTEPATAPPAPREGEEGGGVGPSPSGATPDLNPDAPPAADDPAAAPDLPPEGGATEFTPPAGEGEPPAEPAYAVVEGGPDLDDPAPAPAAQTDPDSLDLNRVVEGYTGRKLTYDDGKAMLELLDFADNLRALPVDAQSTIMQIMSTGQVPMPAPQAPAAPAATPAPDPWDDTPPAAASVDPAIQARLDEMDAWRQQQELAAQQQWQQWVGAEQTAGLNEFATAAPVPLTQEDMILLEQKTMRSGAFAQEMQRTGGQNPRAAYRAALEATFHQDPVLRQRLIDAQVAAQLPTPAEKARVARASSVAAGGGVVPAPAPVDRPKGWDDAKSRIADDLKRLGENG